MKLKYLKSKVWKMGLGKRARSETVLVPETEYIASYSDAKDFFLELFENPKHVDDIEFVDKGNAYIIRAKFHRGAFNEMPIVFERRSSFAFDKHKLMMDVIGAVTANGFYFLKAKKDEIKISKQLEVMG